MQSPPMRLESYAEGDELRDGFESYFRSDIVAGRVGQEQSAPRKEFDRIARSV